MSTTTFPTARRWNLRKLAYSVLALLFGLQSLLIGLFVLAPYPWQPPNLSAPWITRWHSAQSAMGAAVLSGLLLLAALFRPQRKAGLIQLWILEGIFLGPVIALLRIPYLGFEPVGWVMYALSAILIVLYPGRRQLLSLEGEGPASKPLLVLTLVSGALLLPDVWRNLAWQVSGFGGDPALRYFWLQTVFLELILVAAGFLAAIRRPGWPVLGALLGIVYLYFGAVAVSLPGEIGSWGTMGGILSILGGAMYLLATAWEMRKAAATKNG